MVYLYLGIFFIFIIIGITIVVSESARGKHILEILIAFLTGAAVVGGGLIKFPQVETYFSPKTFGLILLSISFGTGFGYYIGMEWKLWVFKRYPQLKGRGGIIGLTISSLKLAKHNSD
ncbi:hypothetical protein JYT44_02550 [Caldithrix abyssi]|nr:hypothetical protein [Caldithrix abyssi]